MIDLFCSEVQYLDHALPVFRALPASLQGSVYVSERLANRAGTGYIIGNPGRSSNPTLVASFQDSQSVHRSGRPVIYLEHGAGQRYLGDPNLTPHPSYAGSPEHEGTILFLTPRDEVSEWWQKAYPDIPSAAVGCPKMDRWHRTPPKRRGDPPVVAISFHSDTRLCPETASGWPVYNTAMPAQVAQLRAAGVEVLGHSHPRIAQRVLPWWRSIGVEAVENFNEVLERADLYACDNSSTIPEFASTGRPVLWLNVPWWRRDVEHHGRFWDWPEGQVQCDEPERLADSILIALVDIEPVEQARRAMVSNIYLATDGLAATRAATAIQLYLFIKGI